MTAHRQLAADDLGVLTGAFEDRLARTTDPRRRTVLKTLIEHLRTEGSSDLDGVLRTVSPAARFIGPDGTGPAGLDEIGAYYASMFARGGIGNMSVEQQRVVVDDDAIVNEVTLVQVVPWDEARRRGYAIDEDTGHYEVRRRICSVVPFDEDGLLQGEITYEAALQPDWWKRVPDDELSPGYRRWLDDRPPT